MSDEEAAAILTKAKKEADAAGINIWSIHMAFGNKIDLSTRDEDLRKEVVASHSRLIKLLEIFDPKIILFHPSYYLELNERDQRKSQLIKSAVELDKNVRAIGSKMVLENMLGPELLASGGRERPLMGTVGEREEIFSQLSAIGLAVDTNHIIDPEKLIRAMGNKLQTLHIADGTGRAENHWFPCTGEVEYDGPFMYESQQMI